MKEIRLHGRGGLGTVKAAEMIVFANVMDGKYGNSIPFFGFERQGAPVTSFVRIDDRPIRLKNQVYYPNAVVVLEPTIMNAVDVFEGITEGSVFVLNTALKIDEIDIPKKVKTVALVDATNIAQQLLGGSITNTIMLGAFAKATEWIKLELIAERARELFGEKNKIAVEKGYELTKVYKR